MYDAYQRGEIDRKQLYDCIPAYLLRTVINEKIDDHSITPIFQAIDKLNNGAEVDLIVGGPPCQAYSIVGRARDKNGMRDDERNYLYRYYGRFLTKYKPKLFVFENVLGLRSAEDGLYLSNMKAYFKRIGYHLKDMDLDARDFGVLQNRKRILIIGWRKDLHEFSLPVFTPNILAYPVSTLLNDLPPLKHGQGTIRAGHYATPTSEYLTQSSIRNGSDMVTLHCARSHTKQDRAIYRLAVDLWNRTGERLRYSDLPKSLRSHKNITSFQDRFKVVAGNDHYAHTVVAHISKDGHHYIHPDIAQNRSLTVREAARLQSFPDNYYFEGIKETNPRTAAFKQIGNAVPPLMAERIGRSIRQVLNSK